jgi:exopolysaccharide biosynthesis operon protein EpsL
VKIIRFAILVALVATSRLATAQIMLDENLLWHQRLFETEGMEDRDRPLKLKVYGGFKHDSNLFRLSDNADAEATIGSSDKSDNIYQIGVGARYELRHSRQKLVLDGSVDQNWFQNFDTLNNTSNNVRGEWGWQAGNSWDGTLGVGHRHYLENFGNVQQNIRDIVDRTRAYGSANFRPLSYLKFTLDLDSVDEDHSEETREFLDNRTNSAAFTANWVTPSKNTVGLKFKRADATYPNDAVFGAAALDNSYAENEYSLVAVWNVTAASLLRGRLGRTERKFDEDPSRNFSGPTWRLGYEWKPTGKTALEMAVWRELSGFEDFSGTYMRTTGIGIFPAWSVVPKLVLQGKAAYQTRDYIGSSPFSPSTGQREDQERLFQLAAVWTPLRLTKLILAVESGDRNSNQTLADYDYYSLGLAAIRTF